MGLDVKLIPLKKHLVNSMHVLKYSNILKNMKQESKN